MNSLLRHLGTAGLLAALALGALMLLPPLAGYQRYVITGGSMGDTIPKGSIVYDRAVPVSSLRVGDVITYTPPAGSGPGGRVTHRIFWIGRGADGAPRLPHQGRREPARPTRGSSSSTVRARRGSPGTCRSPATRSRLWRSAGCACS